MKKTNRTFATFVALLALVVGSAIASAQMAPPASNQGSGTPAQTTMPQTKTIHGTIKSVDPSKKSITMDDGTKLMIAPSASAEAETLKPGAKISAKYEEKGGEKIVTSMQVEPASGKS